MTENANADPLAPEQDDTPVDPHAQYATLSTSPAPNTPLERVTAVATYRRERLHEGCVGVLNATGRSKPENPTSPSQRHEVYHHTCSHCAASMWLRETYPRIEYVNVITNPS